MNSRLRLTTLLATTLLLTACGGGGGGSDTATTTKPPTTTTPVFTMAVASASPSIDENGSGQASFTFGGVSGDVTLAATVNGTRLPADQYSISTDNTNHSLTVAVQEIINEGNLSVEVVATNGNGKTASKTVVFTLNNTSVSADLAALRTVQNNLDNLLDLSQEQRLLSTLSELAYYQGLLKASEVDARQATANAELHSNSLDSLKAELNTLLRGIDFEQRYRSRDDVSEITLETTLVQAKELLARYSQPLNALIASTQGLLGDTASASATLGSYYVDVSANLVSQFYGNPAYGEYLDGQWQYHEAHAYLANLVQPDSVPCSL